MMNRKVFTSLFLAGLVVFAARSAFAAPGVLDTTFGTNGKSSFFFGNCLGNSIARQADGKIVVAGKAFVGSNDFALVRFNADGSTDTNFGSNGKVTTDFLGNDDFASRVRILSSGKILVAGMATGNGGKDFALARYNPDGSLDTSFDPVGHDGKVNRDFGMGNDDTANDMIVQPDGKIIVAGYTGTDFGVMRFNADGSLDTNFGTSGVQTISPSATSNLATCAALQPDGRILLAGYSFISGPGFVFSVVRLNSNGTLDTSFGAGGIVTTDVNSMSFDYAQAILVLKSGKILVGGTTGGGFALVRYTSNGALDTSFGNTGIVNTKLSSGSDTIFCLSELSDGKILAAGDADSDFGMACYHADGSLDTTFGSSGKVTTNLTANVDECRGMAFENDGRILLAGTSNFTEFVVTRYGAAALSASSVADAPKLTVKGKKKRLSTAPHVVIRGKVTGPVTSVTYKAGKRTRTARGTASWKLSIALKPGRNVVTVLAHGPGGDSKPVKVVVIRQ